MNSETRPESHMSDSTRANRRAIRVVIGVFAAILVAFCAWSAYEYSCGQDPLAIFSGSAFQTVEPAEESASTAKSVPVSNTVTTDDVAAQIAKLSYGDKDLSIPAKDVKVVLSGKSIWVEYATDATAEDSVHDAAYRTAALAKWASEQKVSLKKVTWISEDMAGSVRIALEYPCDRASDNETPAQILEGSSSYRISGDAYHALGDKPGFDQEKGDAPGLPDGKAIAVIAEQTATGETLVATGESHTVLYTETVESTEKGGKKDSSITVSLTVDASVVGGGSSSARISVPAGSSVYDVLRASGVNYSARDTQYGIYVESIGGLAEKEHGGTSGWTYYVDGVMPMTSCANYKLAGGESIVWRYVTGE